jgi:hypothetical protein
MSRRTISFLVLLAALIKGAPAGADEIRLKDGTKISGTIVGFENDSFRVETSYGFALVQKDKVADINISVAKKEPEPKPKANTDKVSAAVNSFPAPVKNEPVPTKTVATPTAPVPPAPIVPTPPPPVPPAPPVIHDEIRGNLYVNETYGFRMYKPPSWEMIPAARKALPDAVAALGTFDQTTMLVIGRAPARGSLDAYASATGKALGGVYENYRLISTNHLNVAGLPAVEQRSRGTADGRDWSVVLLTLMRGGDVFTLLGMTWADSDLIQVQENVIAKTVNSLTFDTP